MSADFWAGYISGAASIILGNPLDVLKVRLQAGYRASSKTPAQPSAPLPTGTPVVPSPHHAPAPSAAASYIRPFLLGTAAPVLGYGALNALLFVSYNRTEAFLNRHLSVPAPAPAPSDAATDFQGRGTNLLTTWLAGAVGGLATWVVSAPTELVKCRAQLEIPAQPPPRQSPAAPAAARSPPQTRGPAPAPAPASTSSLAIAKSILHTSGVRGLYLGGAVTALRDSIGYGFYFWGYELCSRWMLRQFPASGAAQSEPDSGVLNTDAARVLLCGGLAGVITWASVFPLDVVKTRLQAQVLSSSSSSVAVAGGGASERRPLLPGGQGGQQQGTRRLGAWDVAKETYRAGGVRPFFRGLGVCSARAFIVNAVQWAVYEWIMAELGQGRRRVGDVVEAGEVSG